MISNDDLIDKPAIGEDRTAWTFDGFRLHGVRRPGHGFSFQGRRQRFSHHVRPVSFDCSRDLWISDESDFNRVVDLVPSLLACVLDPAHEVAR
jgi:hypothetical protein